MRMTFQVCRRQVTRTVRCPSCGKSRQKTFTGEATYNPFNSGEPPVQAMADAERQANKAGREIICQRCEDAPNREALIAFATGGELPERAWGNPTDVLVDRGNISEVIDRSPCPHCQQQQWKVTGYELTDKGRRIVERETGK
jgi:Zn finger protein HypA/HybF involved in hydrogenase expression